MRKHSARKWLHFVLDLLPILVLPIFAIYEINHDHNTPIEVEYIQNEVRDFNQYVKNGDFQNSDYWRIYNYPSTFSFNDNVCTISPTTYNQCCLGQGNIPLIDTHKYLLRCYATSTGTASLLQFRVPHSRILQTVNLVNDIDTLYTCFFTCNVTSDTGSFELLFYGTDTTYTIDVSYVNMFDLTKIYGSGNEPSTYSDFISDYSDSFYGYILSKKTLIVGSSTETLTNTDIGSQMLYAIYKPVKDYFNFNNVFNFGDIYHWFELNMFGGNAPMPIFIVWNIIVYQFLMDLMFLVYSIFMFIIDFTSECLERCFSFSRHGGSR